MLIGIAIEMPFALGEMLLGLEVIDIIGTKCTWRQSLGLLHSWLEDPSNGFLLTPARLLISKYSIQTSLFQVWWDYGGLFLNLFVGWLGSEELRKPALLSGLESFALSVDFHQICGEDKWTWRSWTPFEGCRPCSEGRTWSRKREKSNWCKLLGPLPTKQDCCEDIEHVLPVVFCYNVNALDKGIRWTQC